MLNAKFLQNLVVAYKLSPFIKRAVIIKITVALILFAYWNLGKSEVFRQLDLAVVEMKALDKRNDNLMAKIKDVGMVNQAIQRMEFNVVDSGKVFAGATLDAELLTMVSFHAEQHNLALLSLAARSDEALDQANALAGPPKDTDASKAAEASTSLAGDAKTASGRTKEKKANTAKSKARKGKGSKPRKQSPIQPRPYEVAVKGSFAGIMAFIDGLVHDKRHLRLEDMTISHPNSDEHALKAKADSTEPTARLAFSVYVLNGKEASL